MAGTIGGRSLCSSCVHVRRIRSGRGSEFLLCERALQDPRFAKYPPQPIVRCEGYEAETSGDEPNG